MCLPEVAEQRREQRDAGEPSRPATARMVTTAAPRMKDRPIANSPSMLITTVRAGHHDRAAGGVEGRHGRRFGVEAGRPPLAEPGHHQQGVVDADADAHHGGQRGGPVGRVDEAR